MRILITNDDGINAPGLAVLENIAKTLSDDIWICAPETDQSGLAHSLTLNEPLRLREIDERRFALKGTPTDCVIMGVRELMSEPPDLILSGVNGGQNISDDVTYSGTVAAAMEGTLLGIKSIALSQAYAWIDDKNETSKKVPWETAEALAPDILRHLLAVDFPNRSFVNVNFPNCALDEVAGSRVTSQGSYTHGLFMEKRNDGRGRPYYWLRFGREETEQRSSSDVAAMHENYISITPLKLDLTDEAFSVTLENSFS